MDVLTEEAVRVESQTTASQRYGYASVLLYAAVVLAAVTRHEPWADEAQSWLLARDASLVDLWTRLLHYEGTTGLWQTLLHLLIQMGLPYRGMNVVSGMLGIAAAAVVVCRGPFPLVIRVTLPFTFFLCYQYAVVARSYALLPPLLFLCAASYHRASQRPLLFTCLLCLIAAVSIHGMALALAAGLSVLVTNPNRKGLLPYLAGFAFVVLLLSAAARPVSDGTFVEALNYSLAHLLEVASKAFATAFAGEWIISLAVVALSLPLLWRGGGLFFFALSALLLCAIAAVVYAQLWHHGTLLLAWFFGLWISWPATGTALRLSGKCAVAALTFVILTQTYWTVSSIVYDWDHAYSGSRDAAQALEDLELESNTIDAIGYATIAIEPYFSKNIFANINDGGRQAYWDWSKRNHVNLDSQNLKQLHPEYVIVGYKNEFEHGVWDDSVRKSNYQLVRHFEGNSYWQTHILEPESYDLFQRATAHGNKQP